MSVAIGNAVAILEPIDRVEGVRHCGAHRFWRDGGNLDGALSFGALNAKLAGCVVNTRLRTADFRFKLRRNYYVSLLLFPLRQPDPLVDVLGALQRCQAGPSRQAKTAST
jgi:hypothetical protein